MAFNAVKKGEADGVVTSGPTQCVIIAGLMVIRRIRKAGSKPDY